MSSRLTSAGHLIGGLFIVLLVCGASAAIDLSSALALSDIPLERYILGSLALAAVAWKAAGGFTVARMYREGRYAQLVLPSVLLVVALVVSCSFELSFYKRLFSHQLAAGDDARRTRGDLVRDLSVLDRQIDSRTNAGLSKGELEAKTLVLYATVVTGSGKSPQTLSETTKFCTVSSGIGYLPMCPQIAELNAQIAATTASSELVARRDQIRAQISALPIVASASPLADAAQEILGIDPRLVTLGLALLVMAFVQIGSLCLPAALLGGRQRVVSSSSAPSNDGEKVVSGNSVLDIPETVPSIEQAAPFGVVVGGLSSADGRVRAFVRAHLAADATGALTAALLHDVFARISGSDLTARAFGSRLTAAFAAEGLEVRRGRFGGAGPRRLRGRSVQTVKLRALLTTSCVAARLLVLPCGLLADADLSVRGQRDCCESQRCRRRGAAFPTARGGRQITVARPARAWRLDRRCLREAEHGTLSCLPHAFRQRF